MAAKKKTTTTATDRPKATKEEKPLYKTEPRLLILRGFVDVGGRGKRKYIFGGDEPPLEPPFPEHYQAWVRAGWAEIIEVEVPVNEP